MGGVAGFVGLLVVGVGAVPAIASGNLSGSAFAVSADVSLLNTLKVDVPPTPTANYPAGEGRSVVALDLLEKGDVLSAHLLNASSRVHDDKLTSVGSIADVRALSGSLRAKLIEATCTTDSSHAHGSSKLVEVKFGDRELTVDGDKPLHLDAHGNIAPGGIVSIRTNEQHVDGNVLTVNALHITIGGELRGVVRADIILGQAKCSLGEDSTVVPPTSTSPTSTSVSTPAPTSTSVSTTAPSATTTVSTVPRTTSAAPVPQGKHTDLASTGASVMGAVIAGIVLLGAGVSMLFLQRRRKRS